MADMSTLNYFTFLLVVSPLMSSRHCKLHTATIIAKFMIISLPASDTITCRIAQQISN